MITPWEIYWVLQLDSIGNALLAIAIVGGIATAFIAIIGMFERACSMSYPHLEMSKREAARSVVGLRLARRLAYVFVPLCFLTGFVPSTKTAAAMIVVPQIVNSPAIQHEAGDLYKLAKEALRDAIAPKPSK